MRFSRRKAKSLLHLVNISLIFCTIIHPSFVEIMREEKLGVLRYEIVDVYAVSLNHTIKIVNHSPIAARAQLFIPLIKNVTARHYVILHNFSSSKTVQGEVLNDSYGNTYFYSKDLRIDRKGSFSVELDYYLVSFNIRYLIDSSFVENYDTSSKLYKEYTQAEALIECDHSEIVSQAKALAGNAGDLHEKVRKIYSFVSNHMHYKVQDEERGALWALKNEVGDCSEHSYLFVALCRAVGIPCRIQAGFAFHSTSENLEDGHMWAEYYLENYGWIPVDVTWRLFDVIDGKHFSSIQSVPEVMPYANYFLDCKAGEKNVEDEQTVSLIPCSTGVFGTSFVENVVKTVQKTRQAEFAVFLGKIFGTHLIFPSEAKNVEQTSFEIEVQLQNIIDFWHEKPHISELNAVNTLEIVEETLQNAWMLIVKVFVIFISIPIVIMLIVLFLLKRYQTEEETRTEISFI